MRYGRELTTDHCLRSLTTASPTVYLYRMTFSFPKIYPILDASTIPAEGRAEYLRQLGAELADAGVTLLEYRNKTGSRRRTADGCRSIALGHAQPEREVDSR